jgi:two-component system NarL family sensor kinase
VPRASLEADRLRLVLQLGRRVTSMLDLDTLLPEACHLIADAFEYDMVGISLLDPLDATRLFQAAAFPPERRLPRSFRVPLGSGLTGWVAEHGEPLLVEDVTADPRYIAGPGRERTRSELDVPLKLGDRTIGVLNVESEWLGAFAEDDVPYLQGLAGQLAQAIENARLAARARDLAAAEERARLARDLHDETIQALVALGRQLDLLGLDLADATRAAERLERIQTLLASTLDGVRRLSQNLRPAALEDLGLVAALRSLDLGIDVVVEIRGTPTRLSHTIEYAVYRVAQEALSNAARHSGAPHASVVLAFSEEELVLEVLDAGRGFGPGGRSAGQGLHSMRDRSADIGAELRVESRPGSGTLVRLSVPLALTLLDGR